MLGLDVLVNTANIFYLLSYSVKDIFWLRILTVVAALFLLPYYYMQSTPLWTPIGWNLFFTAINIFWIIRILLDRRPAPFTDEESHLYKTALPNFAERDAFRFLRAGKLTTAQAGSVLMTQGTPVRTLSLIVDGEVSVEINGAEVDSLGGSRFLGSIAFLSDRQNFSTPVTVRTTRPTRLLTWEFADLDSEFGKNPDLQISIEASLGLEIARYLQVARIQLPQLAT